MNEKRSKLRIVGKRLSTPLAVLLAVSMLLAGGGCFSSGEGELYYGRVIVPRVQEFRWSDGGLPRVFDPALAAAPPDTDVVRAMYEGLTDYDPRNLTPVSAVAMRWESSPDNRKWTFYLRRDARWSNDDPVTARDFVNSWQRTLRLGDRAPHAKLLENIEGAQNASAPPSDVSQRDEGADTNSKGDEGRESKEDTEPQTPAPLFGVEAVSDYILRVRLQRPDKNFPALVAHPVFRPVHVTEATNGIDSQKEYSDPGSETIGPQVVSNGAFRLTSLAPDGVVLERAKNYWNAKTVALERVRFVPTRNAEAALAAYRAGEVDAVTNAAFEPLAVKLLATYKDFRRETYGALTYYSFNTSHALFNNIRIREALAIAIDRDRLSADVMDGVTEPAKKFLPDQVIDVSESEEVGESKGERPAVPLEYNVERARRLMIEAGFAGGMGFPRIRLLVNRNEQQRRMAQAIAAMWRSALGVETDIIVLNWDEYMAALRSGDYDLARRSMVMQTTDEETNMLSMFDHDALKSNGISATNQEQAAEPTNSPAASGSPQHSEAEQMVLPSEPQNILTEAQALKKLPAIPIYFASSYSLVKPYVVGFNTNLLDVHSLANVRIDTSWQPERGKGRKGEWEKGRVRE